MLSILFKINNFHQNFGIRDKSVKIVPKHFKHCFLEQFCSERKSQISAHSKNTAKTQHYPVFFNLTFHFKCIIISLI